MGYNDISHLRPDRRQGGGITIVFKKNIKVKDYTTRGKVFKTMEYANLSLHFNVKTINLYVFYRWAATSVIDFCNELVCLFKENITNDKGDIILIGDFNIHRDDMGRSDTLTFLDTLDSLDLRNHVNFSTHRSQHYLDLFIDSRLSPTITEIRQGFMLSDHHFTHSRINITKERALKATISYRKIKSMNHGDFCNNVLLLFLVDPGLGMIQL